MTTNRAHIESGSTGGIAQIRRGVILSQLVDPPISGGSKFGFPVADPPRTPLGLNVLPSSKLMQGNQVRCRMK